MTPAIRRYRVDERADSHVLALSPTPIDAADVPRSQLNYSIGYLLGISHSMNCQSGIT